MVAAFRSRARFPSLGADVMEHAPGIVENLRHVDATADELGASLVDVEDGELQSLDRARRSRRDPLVCCSYGPPPAAYWSSLAR
jgi:hypothetical protein